MMQSRLSGTDNPFTALIDPLVVLSAVDRSEKLAALTRRVHRTFEEGSLAAQGRAATLQDLCAGAARAEPAATDRL